MNTLRKFLVLIISLASVFTFLYFPNYNKDRDKSNVLSAQNNSIVKPAEAAAYEYNFTPTYGFPTVSPKSGVQLFFELGGEMYAFGAGNFYKYNPSTNTWAFNSSINGDGTSCSTTYTNVLAKVFSNRVVIVTDAAICGGNFNVRQVRVLSRRASGVIGLDAIWSNPTIPLSGGGASGYSMGIHGGSLYILIRSNAVPTFIFRLDSNFSNLQMVCNGNAPISGSAPTPGWEIRPCIQVVALYDTAPGNPNLLALIDDSDRSDQRLYRVATISFFGSNPNYRMQANIFIAPGRTLSPQLTDSNANYGTLLDKAVVGSTSAGIFYALKCQNNPSGGMIEYSTMHIVNVTMVGAYYDIKNIIIEETKTGWKTTNGTCGTNQTNVNFTQPDNDSYVLNGAKYLLYSRNGVNYGYLGYTKCLGNLSILDARRVQVCRNGGSGDVLRAYGITQNGTAGGGNFVSLPPDIRVTNMYYSPTLDKVFFALKNDGNTGLIQQNFVPSGQSAGIWTHSYAPPVENLCANMVISSPNMTQGAPSTTITVTGTTTNTTPTGGRFDFYYGPNSYFSKTPTSIVLGANNTYTMTFNLPNYIADASFGTQVSQGVYQMTVRVLSPGATTLSTTANCVKTITFEKPRDPSIVNYLVPGTGFYYSCSSDQPLNPFRLKMTISGEPSSFPGATVTRIVAVIMPAGSTQKIQFNPSTGQPITSTANYIVIDTSNVYSTKLATNAFAFTTDLAVTAATPGASRTLTFNVNFNSDVLNNAFIASYYGDQTSNSVKKDFVIAAIVIDSTGRTNLDASSLGQNANSQLGVGAGKLAPIDECSTLYYKTTNGDIRSAETKSVVGTDGTNLIAQYDRILKTVTPLRGINGDGSDKRKDNTIRVADYSYQGQALSSCGAELSKVAPSVTELCKTLNLSASTPSNLKLASQIQQFNTILSTAGSNPSIYINETYNSGIYKNSNTPISLNLSSITSPSPNLLNIVHIGGTSGRTVTITDSSSALKNLIIWCSAPNCKLVINPLSTGVGFTVDNNNKVQLFPNNALSSVKDLSRIYFNPSGPIVLKEGTATYPNFYTGAFVTGDYFYSDNSSKTAIIDGLVASKGIVAGGSGLTNSNISLYFRSFWNGIEPMPFLYINYEPKYIYAVSVLNVVEADNVPRELIGL